MSGDKWVIRAIVIFIGLTVLIIVIGSFVLAYQGKAIDDFFKVLASAALGAISALLAKTGYERATQDVQVVNRPDEGIPVVDAEV